MIKLIEAKRDGAALSPAEITGLVRDFTAGRLPDYQVAAFLMAVFFRGMTTEETRALTLAMRDSGEVLRLPPDPRPVVDKHSTGGVGDKVSLPLAPLLACLGFRVPMISGRGLGITGGTLDKLESIPGFRTALTREEIVAQVQELGCVMCGQTENMVPADRLIYALRDVTGTVPSIPLITASILSKKLAEGLDALVLDVKFGCAAFMQTLDKARELAHSMVALGTESGVNIRALLTRMDTPLGCAVGNWLEVKESVECLEGRGPGDLHELVIECAASLLVQTGRHTDPSTAKLAAQKCLDSGAPRQKWNDMVAAQGGDVPRMEEWLKRDSLAPAVLELRSESPGFVVRCDARIIGEVVRDLGGGRLNKTSPINPVVGIECLAKPDEAVQIGTPIFRIHAATTTQAEAAETTLRSAIRVATEPPTLPPLILHDS